MPGLMLESPPFRLVAPLHRVHASKMTTMRHGLSSKSVRRTLVPAIPLPMITTSAESGNGERKDAGLCGGACQYGCVGFESRRLLMSGMGRLLGRPAKGSGTSERRGPCELGCIAATGSDFTSEG